MILTITRDQSKGLLGGISFELRAQVELTQEEAELINKYKVHKEALFTGVSKFFGKTLEYDIKVGELE